MTQPIGPKTSNPHNDPNLAGKEKFKKDIDTVAKLNVPQKDTVSISSKAKEEAKMKKWVDTLMAMDDVSENEIQDLPVRSEEVARVKKEIAKGDYLNQERLSKTASQIIPS